MTAISRIVTLSVNNPIILSYNNWVRQLQGEKATAINKDFNNNQFRQENIELVKTNILFIEFLKSF